MSDTTTNSANTTTEAERFAPIWAEHVTRTLTPWVKALNTGGTITRRQAQAMTEIMRTKDLTPRDIFLLTALDPAIEPEDVTLIVARTQAGVNMFMASMDQVFNNPHRASPATRTTRARALLDIIQRETPDLMPTAVKAYIEWYEDDTDKATRDAATVNKQDPEISLAAIVLSLLGHAIKPAWANQHHE